MQALSGDSAIDGQSPTVDFFQAGDDKQLPFFVIMALAAQTTLQVSEILEIRRVSHEPEGSDHCPEISAQLFGPRIDCSLRRDRHFSRSAREYDPRIHQNRKAIAL